MFSRIRKSSVFYALPLFCALAMTATAARASVCRLYTTDYNTATVRVMDCTDNKNTPMSPIPVGQQPFGIVASPDQKWLYVANYASDSVTIIDTDSNVPVYTVNNVGDGPIGIAVSKDGRRVYVANYLGDSVSVINIPTDLTQPSVIATIQFPSGSQPDNLALSKDGQVLYVARWHDYKVSLVDLASANYDIVQTFDVQECPSAIAVSNDGTRVYVANEFGGGNGSITVLDSTVPKANTILTTWALPYQSYPQQQIALSANGRYLYVPREGQAANLMIDTTDGSMVNHRVDPQPMATALSSDGSLVYITHGNVVSMFDSGLNKPSALPDVTLGTNTSWLLNMAVVRRCS
jgi:YVTN family beta-propeller protein